MCRQTYLALEDIAATPPRTSRDFLDRDHLVCLLCPAGPCIDKQLLERHEQSVHHQKRFQRYLRIREDASQRASSWSSAMPKIARMQSQAFWSGDLLHVKAALFDHITMPSTETLIRVETAWGSHVKRSLSDLFLLAYVRQSLPTDQGTDRKQHVQDRLALGHVLLTVLMPFVALPYEVLHGHSDRL